VFAANYMAQTRVTNAPGTKKYAEALEAQITCKQKVQPLKAIRALQKAGIISPTTYIVSDSVSFFRVKKPMTVFGYKPVAVIGFDYYPRVFARGPGTSPGILLGILVTNPVNEVKTKLSFLDQQKVMIDEVDDTLGPPQKPRTRTEIYCFRWN
jgi:hypothetical protein